jgi:hypothetical protein
MIEARIVHTVEQQAWRDRNSKAQPPLNGERRILCIAVGNFAGDSKVVGVEVAFDTAEEIESGKVYDAARKAVGDAAFILDVECGAVAEFLAEIAAIKIARPDYNWG